MKSLGTWLKLVVVVLVWGFFYWVNAVAIQEVTSNPNLSIYEKSASVAKIMLGLPAGPIENNKQVEETNYATSATPITLSDQEMQSENYLRSLEAAQFFNQAFDSQVLNQAFTNQINQARSDKGWESLMVGSHLQSGAYQRAQQLSDYHYLGHDTLDGQAFWSLYPLENASYRLGENLYEVYISVDDIRLTTWQNTDIFAQYLAGAFQSVTQTDTYQAFYSQNVQVIASATDYAPNGQAYVRLVAVLVMDTE